MGLFNREPRPTVRTGNRKADQTLANVLNDITEHGRRGNETFAFTISPADIGASVTHVSAYITSNFPRFIQEAGHSIISIEPEPWSERVHFIVKPGTFAEGVTTVDAAIADAGGGPANLVQAIHDAVQQYRHWFHTGDLSAIWTHRLALEDRWSSEAPKSKPDFDAFERACGADYFWVNALPAFAGLYLGYTVGTPVFQFAGNADAHLDRGDSDQVALMTAINERARSAF